MQYWKAQGNLEVVDIATHKVGDFHRDAVAVLTSWIMANRAIAAEKAAGNDPSTNARLKTWNDEMNSHSFDFTDPRIGSKLCKDYVEPKSWAPVCNQLYTDILDKVQQVSGTSRYTVDDALVAFLV